MVVRAAKQFETCPRHCRSPLKTTSDSWHLCNSATLRFSNSCQPRHCFHTLTWHHASQVCVVGFVLRLLRHFSAQLSCAMSQFMLRVACESVLGKVFVLSLGQRQWLTRIRHAVRRPQPNSNVFPPKGWHHTQIHLVVDAHLDLENLQKLGGTFAAVAQQRGTDTTSQLKYAVTRLGLCSRLSGATLVRISTLVVFLVGMSKTWFRRHIQPKANWKAIKARA